MTAEGTPIINNQDASYVEHWLCNQLSCDIITLFDMFKKEHNWKVSRMNEAFSYVFNHSKRITW